MPTISTATGAGGVGPDSQGTPLQNEATLAFNLEPDCAAVAAAAAQAKVQETTPVYAESPAH